MWLEMIHWFQEKTQKWKQGFRHHLQRWVGSDRTTQGEKGAEHRYLESATCRGRKDKAIGQEVRGTLAPGRHTGAPMALLYRQKKA